MRCYSLIRNESVERFSGNSYFRERVAMQIKIYNIIRYFIALVWLINGLFCKLLNFAPRHEEIVRRILGGEYSIFLTKTIGLAEICMTIWILSGILSRLNAVTQILIIAAMNVLEFYLAPDLLLWGRWNIVIAFLFIALIYANEFYLMRK
jgi:hypothetical protein